MNNIIDRVWKQSSMTYIEDLQGSAFSAESGGHTFRISGVDSEENPLALSGSVAASFLRPDQATVAISGAVSGGVVSVTLPANCYDIPGRFGLVIFLTSDGQKTAIYSCVGNVARSSTSAVAPQTTADVVDLINQINAAVATIPASYTNLMAAVAPTYSSSALYPVGAYAWNDGKLYRAISPITTAESWTAAHWIIANLGDDVRDLKSAFITGLNARLDAENSIQKYEIGIDLFTNATYFPRSADYFVENGNYITLKKFTTGSNYVAINIPVVKETDYRIAFFPSSPLQFAKYAFLDSPISAPTNNIGTIFTDPIIVNSEGHGNLILIFQMPYTNPDTGIEIGLYAVGETVLETVAKGFAPIENINLFDKSKVTSGNYVRYDNGSLATGANYSATDFIPVTPGEKYTVNVGSNVGVQQMAFYKANKSYLSGLANTGVTLQTTVTAPSNAAYMRWTIINANINQTQIQKGEVFTGYVEYGEKKIPSEYIPESRNYVEVGSGKQFSSVLRALKETDDSVEVHVLAGTYDIYNEYVEYYGADFWSNYTGYDGVDDRFYRGLWISGGRKIIFDPRATITFNNISGNASIESKFSVFATGYNATIEGANVIYSGVRYAIHDDYATLPGTNIFKNCIFDGTPYSNAVIGAGLGTNNEYIIENCVFLNNNGIHDISYHGSTAGTSKCKIIVRNCYGSKRCAFRWYGASQEVTDCIVSSCRFGEIVCQAYDAQQTHENMRLYAFCNETN